jgi:oxygen-dependent protoporphyrinogen oxidase
VLTRYRFVCEAGPVSVSESVPHVVVVGGGISGLAAALAVIRHASGPVQVTVLEGSATVGGKLALHEVGGVVLDSGAESMLARRPEGVRLARAVGLGPDLVHPAVSGACVWTRGHLRPLPAGQLMGLPGDLRALAASRVLSLRGLARIPLDHLLPRTRVSHDVSVGAYVSGRLGREVVDRLVEPLLGGVYAGHADELSLDATVPQLSGAVRVERSLLEAVRQILGSSVPRPSTWQPAEAAPVFASVRGGLGRLPAAVAVHLRSAGATVRTGVTVRQLRRTPDGWRLVVGSTRNPEVVLADAVILAVPAAPAARLLAAVARPAADVLGTVEYASVALVTCAFRAADVAGRLHGTGFLVPPVDGRFVKAATYASTKWGWLADSAPELALVRTSVGRHHEVADLQRDDVDLADLALADLCAATGIAASPVDVAVTRWGGALPQYSVGHLDKVAGVRRGVAALPGLAVCGAAYDGVGVPACIGSGEAAATRVLAAVDQRRQWRHG